MIFSDSQNREFYPPSLPTLTTEEKKGTNSFYPVHVNLIWALCIHLFNINLLSSYYVIFMNYRHLEFSEEQQR